MPACHSCLFDLRSSAPRGASAKLQIDICRSRSLRFTRLSTRFEAKALASVLMVCTGWGKSILLLGRAGFVVPKVRSWDSLIPACQRASCCSYCQASIRSAVGVAIVSVNLTPAVSVPPSTRALLLPGDADEPEQMTATIVAYTGHSDHSDPSTATSGSNRIAHLRDHLLMATPPEFSPLLDRVWVDTPIAAPTVARVTCLCQTGPSLPKSRNFRDRAAFERSTPLAVGHGSTDRRLPVAPLGAALARDRRREPPVKQRDRVAAADLFWCLSATGPLIL